MSYLVAVLLIFGCNSGSSEIPKTLVDSPNPPHSDQGAVAESAELNSASIADFLGDREAVEFYGEFRDSLHRSGKFKSADFDRLSDLVATYSEVDDLWELLGDAIFFRQDWEALIDHHRSRTPEKRDHDKLAVAYLRAQRYEEAAQYLEEIIAEYGSSNERQWMLAVAAYHSGRGEEASRILAPLIPQAEGPHLAELLQLRGQLAHQREDWAEAEASYKQALEIMPDQIGWLNRYVQILRLRGQDNAATDLEARTMELQREADQRESTQRLMAALANNLEIAWDQRDLEVCLNIIGQMEPHADAGVRQVLEGYRREIARLRGN